LVPGLGGTGRQVYPEVCKNGMNDNVDFCVNSQERIIYASDQKDFAQVSAEKG